MLRLLFNNAWCGTLLKAFFMSINTHNTQCFLSRDCCQSWTKVRRGIIVERPLLKPNWWSERTEFCSKCSRSRWNGCFSRHLLMIDSNDIGRKERTSWHSEVSLGIGITSDSFQSDGNLPVLMERLKREDMDGEIASEKVCSIQAVIPSGPVAVPHFTFLSSASLESYNHRKTSPRQGRIYFRWYKC